VKLIIDMNLSPNWVPLFQAAGHQAHNIGQQSGMPTPAIGKS
jgi:hypothetical protein